jgi:hypothetical protein
VYARQNMDQRLIKMLVLQEGTLWKIGKDRYLTGHYYPSGVPIPIRVRLTIYRPVMPHSSLLEPRSVAGLYSSIVQELQRRAGSKSRKKLRKVAV